MNSWRMMAYVEWLNNISSWSRRGRSNSCRHGESYSRVGILHHFTTIQLHTLWCQIVPAWVFIRNSLSLPTIVFMEGKLNFINTGLDMNFIWRIVRFGTSRVARNRLSVPLFLTIQYHSVKCVCDLDNFTCIGWQGHKEAYCFFPPLPPIVLPCAHTETT